MTVQPFLSIKEEVMSKKPPRTVKLPFMLLCATSMIMFCCCSSHSGLHHLFAPHVRLLLYDALALPGPDGVRVLGVARLTRREEGGPEENEQKQQP